MDKKTIEIGLDPGFGNFKIYSGSATVTSANVYLSIRGNLGLSEDDTALVEWAGNAYHVGPYAAHKGIGQGASFGFDRLTEGGPEIKALFYRAMHAHLGASKRVKSLALFCAMPVESMIQGRGKETNEALRAWLLGDHEWAVNGEQCRVNVEKVATAPQPVAALWDYELDINKGAVLPVNNASGRILVCSIGMNTIEMVGFDAGRIVEAQTSGAKAGVRFLIESIAAQTGDEFSIADTKMRAGMIDKAIYERALSGYWATVRKAISKQWGDSWQDAHKVIVTGGGTLLLAQQLRSFFGAKLHIPKDSDGCSGAIISIARGMYKRSILNGN